MLCPLWDPIVFTIVEHIYLKLGVSQRRQHTSPKKKVYWSSYLKARTVITAPCTRQYRATYRTVSTSSRRYTHLRCRTSPTTRNEKTDKTTKYVTTKTAGILYPTMPCSNTESGTGWKTHQIEKLDVPQHQPQYDNRAHSWIHGDHQRSVKGEI